MSNRLPWRTAIRIAFRDAAASRTRFLFLIAAVAVGVGSLAGVRGFSESCRNMLLSNARTLMAADLSVRTFETATPAQLAALEEMEGAGVRRTWITETVSMMGSAGAPAPVLVSVKAVDPSLYPFYGSLQLDPPGTLREKLDAASIGVSEDLLLRLQVKAGDSVRLGASEFRIAAVVRVEPDRMTGSLNVGPRVLISRQGLDRSGLIRTGSRAAQRYLFRLSPGGETVAAVRVRLKQVFPNALIADFRETHPLITRGLNRATRFLSLVSLIALVVGALGVAAAMHSHIRQRMDTIAVLKCLGASSSHILRIFAVQTLLVGLAGGVAGGVVGAAIEWSFPRILASYVPVPASFAWHWRPALEAIGIGTLTALLFTFPRLLAVRWIRPAIVLRRDMAEARPSWRERWRRWRAPAAAAGGILAGIAGIAAWLAGGSGADAARVGGFFAGGLAAGVAALSAAAWLLLAGLRLLLAKAPPALPASWRHGIANLYRPGNQAQAALVTLGVGVMFTLTVFLLQRGLLSQIIASAPPNMPNVFLLNLTDREHAGFLALIGKQPGVEGRPEVVPLVSVRLAAIDGAPVERLTLRGWSRRFTQTRSVTWREQPPPQTEIVQGAWWKGKTEPSVCVTEDAARILALRLGASVEWTSAGRAFRARVACVYRSEAMRMGGADDFVFSPGALDGLPRLYFGNLRMQPARVAAFQKEAFERFPTVTVINAADVIAIVQDVVDQIALVVRFVSLFTILAGLVILASSIAGTRFHRMREVAILKTLGASRGRVGRIFSIEFLILGLAAGVMGSLLASGFAWLLLSRLLDAPFRLDPLPNLAAIALTAVLAIGVGWAASYRILGHKPLEVLRQE